MKNSNKFAVVSAILAAAVADDGTFDVAYPTGTTQADFNAGLAGSNGVMIVNGNDRYAEGASGFTASYGAGTITVTNTTGAALAAGSEITLQFDQVDGNDVVVLEFPIELASVANGDVVTDYRPGFDGTIEDVSFVTNKPVTTAAKLATLNLEIGATNLTGGVVALTSATVTPQGKIIAGTAITGNNAFKRGDAISVEASAVTAFVEGSGTLMVRCRRSFPNDAY